MKRIIMKVSSFLVVALVMSILLVPVQNIQAKGKTVYYDAHHYTISRTAPRIKKFDIKKNKLIIWGSLEKSKDEGEKAVKLKSKKRTFKLAKKVKVTLNYGEDSWRVPKKYWKQNLNEAGMHYRITVKNGKVTEILIYD